MRRVRPKKAQLVVSPDRGYGKSHLLGRLFTTLGPRATKVYLRPFQDPFKAWHSILLLTVQELLRPEQEKTGALTQLEALALVTVAHIIADFIAGGGIPNYSAVEEAVEFLRQVRLDAPGAEEQIRLSYERFANEAGLFNKLALTVGRRGIDLFGREKAWLRILAACALDDEERRYTAVKWLRAEPLDTEEMMLLRLETADNEGRGDSSAQEINDLGFRRLRGLCLLASYYRPFVFCFDQTEFYGSDRLMVRTLGNCFDQLFVDLPNHLTVITANQENWITEILPHIASPQANRISLGIQLEEFRKEGAHELIVERLNGYGLDASFIDSFFASEWLEHAFDPVPILGARACWSGLPSVFARLDAIRPHHRSRWKTYSNWRSMRFGPNKP